jgi:large subunit ribosomal protein L28
MASCELCGKTTSFGNKVTKVRTGLYSRSHRTIKPNLHKTTLVIDGRMKKVTACTSCIRSARKIRQ